MLRKLQDFLARLYRIEPPADVHDYLITDAAHARALAGKKDRETEEKLLVAEGDDVSSPTTIHP